MSTDNCANQRSKVKQSLCMCMPAGNLKPFEMKLAASLSVVQLLSPMLEFFVHKTHPSFSCQISRRISGCPDGDSNYACTSNPAVFSRTAFLGGSSSPPCQIAILQDSNGSEVLWKPCHPPGCTPLVLKPIVFSNARLYSTSINWLRFQCCFE